MQKSVVCLLAICASSVALADGKNTERENWNVTCEPKTELYEVWENEVLVRHTAEVYYVCGLKDVQPNGYQTLCPFSSKKKQSLLIPLRAGAIEDYKDKCEPGTGPK